VDSHAHIISDDPGRYPYAPLGGRLPEWMGERAVSAARLLEVMPQAGVGQAVLVQYSSVHGYVNDYAVDTARLHPGRFAAVCTVDPSLAGAADTLRYWVRERGAAGVRLRAAAREGPLDYVTAEPIWRAAGELGIPLCVHLMQNGQAAGLPLLRGMLDRFPEVTVVLDHAGNPPWQEGPPFYGAGPVIELARYPRLVIKFATINIERLQAAQLEPRIGLELLVGAFGAERIMWGSDMPNTPGAYPDMVRHMQAAMAGLGPTEQAAIMGGTARRVYPRLQPRAAYA
jgi:predicted TIM-barrel fold metal-dependent hydrolase